jgi:hypothetical protein
MLGYDIGQNNEPTSHIGLRRNVERATQSTDVVPKKIIDFVCRGDKHQRPQGNLARALLRNISLRDSD